jgi:hypothetical protein
MYTAIELLVPWQWLQGRWDVPGQPVDAVASRHGAGSVDGE